MEITLTLTVEETNAVLASLGAQPFNAVQALVAKIQAQGQEQLQPPAPPKKK